MKMLNYIFLLIFLIGYFAFADVLGTGVKGPALIEGFNQVVSAGGTTNLSKDSQTKQLLTGSANQIYVLPSATTIPLSRRFLFINKSSGNMIIKDFAAGDLLTLGGGGSAEIHLRAAGSTAGTWDVLTGSGGGGGGGGALRAGVENIPNGTSEVDITFSTPVSDTFYRVSVSVWNYVDASPRYLTPVGTDRTTSGFKVKLNAPVNSANYFLEYIVNESL